jgi:hypothetical protein
VQINWLDCFVAKGAPRNDKRMTKQRKFVLIEGWQANIK